MGKGDRGGAGDEGERKRDHPFIDSLSKCLPQLRLDQAKVRIPELKLGLPWEGQRPKHLRYHLWSPTVHISRKTESEAEPELEVSSLQVASKPLHQMPIHIHHF